MFNKIWWFIKLNYILPIKLIALPFLGIMYLMDLLFILVYRLEMYFGVKDYYDHSVFTVGLILMGYHPLADYVLEKTCGIDITPASKASGALAIFVCFLLLCFYYGKRSDKIVHEYSQYTTAELFNWKRIIFLVFCILLSIIWIPLYIYESK